MSTISLAFAAADINPADVVPAVKVKPAKRKPAVKGTTKAQPKRKVSAADKEGAAQTRRDIVAAAAGKAASKVFKVTAAAKAGVTRARANMVKSNAALEHAVKLAGGKTEAFRAAMAKAYGDDWHTLKAGAAESDSDKARAMLINQERVALQKACEAAKMSGPRKPWSDAGKAQVAFLAAKALTDAGLDPALEGKRSERTIGERIIIALLPLYTAHQKKPADSDSKATDAIFHIGKALLALDVDLTQANLAGKN